MAITTTTSAQLNNDGNVEPRKYPIDDHGKTRWQYGKVTQGAALGDDGSFVEFFDLPAGRIRILPQLMLLKSSALGAARVLKIGHRAYYDRSTPPNATIVAEDDDAFMLALDVSAATVKQGDGTLENLKFDIYSRAGVRVFGTVTGGTIPIAATLEFMMPYIMD